MPIARNPLEVIGEIDHTVWGPVHIVAGGGVGIASNYGGPDYRFYGGVGLLRARPKTPTAMASWATPTNTTKCRNQERL